MSRAIALSRAALALAAASLAACGDDPTSPAAARGRQNDIIVQRADSAVPSASRFVPILPKSRIVEIEITTSDPGFVPQTTVEFVTDGNAQQFTDNGPGDLDPRMGHYEVQLPPSYFAWTARVVAAPAPFTLEGATSAPAIFGTVVTTFAPIKLRAQPMLLARVWDQTDGPLAAKPLGGATIEITDPTGAKRSITDNVMGPHGDWSAWAGIVQAWGTGQGAYTLCITAGPVGYLLPTIRCGTVQATYDGQHTVHFALKRMGR